jgi:type I site-specific restriction-modification system R (restriction) subunit
MSGLKRPPPRIGGVYEASSAPKSKAKEDANARTKEDANAKTKEDANATTEPQGKAYVEKLKKILNMIKGIAQKNKQKDEAAAELQEVVKAMKKNQEIEKKRQPDNHSDIMSAIHLLIKEVNEVKEAVKAPKTYAQAAALTTKELKKPQLSPEKKTPLEQAKKERALYEMKINMTKASTETNKLISSSPPKDITARMQKVINGRSPEDKPIILGVNRLGTTALKLHFRKKEDAAKAKSLDVDWGQAYEGPEAEMYTGRIEARSDI